MTTDAADTSGAAPTTELHASDVAAAPVRDRGGVLILVLVTGVIASLFVLPILSYVTSVAKANRVTSDKVEAIELAEGGTLVALNNQGSLFDICTGTPLPMSLDDVTTTCEVLDTETQYDPENIPHDVAVIQADEQVPAGIGVDAYVNPNTADDPAAWLTAPDWTSSQAASAGRVWMPELPVRPVGNGAARDRVMQDGAQDPNYPSCRVFFPGTYSERIEIDEPAYFVSGVYSFTEPVVLESGADVVAGGGTEIGCTNDFEASAGVVGGAPIPVNSSGFGATFVLGGSARIVVDDSEGGDIRFEMNQRYVGPNESSVAASDGVSIVTVNGDHEPFVGGGSPGDDLVIPGVIAVPASTIGIEGSPRAAEQGYRPSRLTPKPTPPDAPTIVSAEIHQRDRDGNTGPRDRGRVTVFWEEPAANGSRITGYTVTDSATGRTCSPAVRAGHEIRTSCTIDGLRNNQEPDLTVVAVNDIGPSQPSPPFSAGRVDLSGSVQSPSASTPAPAPGPRAVVHPDGVFVEWETPDDGGSPVTGYEITVTAVEGGDSTTCRAEWNELACVAPLPVLLGEDASDDDDGPDDDADDDADDDDAADDDAPALVELDVADILELSNSGDLDGVMTIEIVAVHTEGAPGVDIDGSPSPVPSSDITVSTDPAPDLTPSVPALDVRDALLDFTSESSAEVEVSIAGYVSVPEGRIAIGASDPSNTSVSMTGGVLAADLDVDPDATPTLDIRFDNPIGQKTIRLTSTTSDPATVTSTAIVQVNKSGSLAVNSWMVQ